MILVHDRKTKEMYEEKEFGKDLLDFLYNNPFGRIILKTFIITKFYSKLKGKKERSKKSRYKIQPFIEEYSIDMSRYEEKEYDSFDDFFTRKLKKNEEKVDLDKKSFISPADAKLQVYNVDNNTKVHIKGVDYALEDLLKDVELSAKYKEGICLVYRLSVDDYHRYCYIDDGKVLSSKCINGKLHTVRPIANRYKVFRENHREYALLRTSNLDDIVYMEVGAMQIGKINNHDLDEFKKGEEKGYFSYGASTIVILVKKDVVKIDEDILKMSEKDVETKVRYGEVIGKIIR